MRQHNRQNLSDLQYTITAIILLIIAVVPVMIAEAPPLADYPNHLARIHTWLKSLSGHPIEFIEPIYAIQPNLAFDVLVITISQALGLENAGRVFIALTMASVAIGPALLGRQINGNFTIWSLLPFLLIFNRLFFWGFLGYLFSLGIAIAVSALWLNQQRGTHTPKWQLSRSIVVFLILTCHLYAFGVLGLLALTFSILEISKSAIHTKLQALKEIAIRLLPFAITVPLFLITSPAFDTGRTITWSTFSGKIIALSSPLIGTSSTTDIAAAAATLALLSVLIASKQISLPRWALITLLMLTIIHLLMPDKLFSSYGADRRLPIAIFLIGCAFIKAENECLSYASLIACGSLAIVFFVRVTTISIAWLEFQETHEEFKRTTSQLKPGSSIIALIGTTTPQGLPKSPLTEHAAYAVIWKDVFWPGIFSYPIHGAQSIQFNPKNISTSDFSLLQKIKSQDLILTLQGLLKTQSLSINEMKKCYQYLLAAQDEGFSKKLPQSTPFGKLLHEEKHFALYENTGLINCPYKSSHNSQIDSKHK